jgi:hypothetical protein
MGNRFIKKVSANAKKQLREYRKSGAWLNNAPLLFDHSLQLSVEQNEHLRPVFESCGLSARKENRINFEILVANLFAVQKRCPVIVSLNSNGWKKTQYTKAGNSTIKIINKLHKRGYIEMKKGHTYQPDPREARIWAMEKLLSYFRELPNSVIYKPVELVILRDAEGKPKEYDETRKTSRIRSILKHANDVNGKAEIRCGKYKLDAFLVAIFNREFTLYGRLHTRGSRWHYQGFSKKERQEFTINGDRTTELDFSGFHPRLLYAKEGIQFPVNGDPYSVIINDPQCRDLLKIALLSLMNAGGKWIEYEYDHYKTGKHVEVKWWMTPEQQPVGVINHELKNDPVLRKRLEKIGITEASQIIDAFREAHKPIAHYFCNGKDNGLRIMNQDATIALAIVKHFTSKNIPILAIHDSFIVQAKHRNQLRETMQRIYRKHTGFDCPVKREF